VEKSELLAVTDRRWSSQIGQYCRGSYRGLLEKRWLAAMGSSDDLQRTLTVASRASSFLLARASIESLSIGIDRRTHGGTDVAMDCCGPSVSSSRITQRVRCTTWGDFGMQASNWLEADLHDHRSSMRTDLHGKVARSSELPTRRAKGL
jgi:hypothetical protein